MAKHSLVIVESPAKAKTIGKYLGKDYEVKACMGHLRDLQKSSLSVDVDNDFEPVYKPIKGKEAIISDLKKSAKAADTVYLATDPGPGGRGHQLAPEESAESAGRQDKAGHLQRNHQERGAPEHPESPGHRPESGGCPAGPENP